MSYRYGQIRSDVIKMLEKYSEETSIEYSADESQLLFEHIFIHSRNLFLACTHPDDKIIESRLTDEEAKKFYKELATVEYHQSLGIVPVGDQIFKGQEVLNALRPEFYQKSLREAINNYKDKDKPLWRCGFCGGVFGREYDALVCCDDDE
jgi:hypothetical protein